MAGPNGNREALPSFPELRRELDEDGWPDAPQGGFDEDLLGADDELDAIIGRSTPSYDLGPTTETITIDLSSTGSFAAVPHPEPAPEPEPEAQYQSQDQHDGQHDDQPPEPPYDEYLTEPLTDREPVVRWEPEPEPAPEPAADFEPERADLPPAPSHPPYQPMLGDTGSMPAVAATPDPPRPSTTRDFGLPPAPGGGAGADSLTADTVLHHRRERPQTGWRRRVLRATGGKVNFGPSPDDLRRADLLEQARTPVTDCHRLAVISLKGGVGKTTTTAALGAMLADLRGDRVIAVDANPDRGTLGERVPRESGATVRHLLRHRADLQRYADVRAFTNQGTTRLEVLASDADPGASLAFSEQDYRDTVATLERFYNLILTDCGTGLLHDAMRGILGMASSLVVVSSASLDGARSASATLDWLEAHGFEHLARNAVVVISSVRPGGGMVDVLQLEDHFAARCRDVISVPYDRHLEAGGVLELDELDPQTREAYFELAAAVGGGFAAASLKR